MVVMCMTVTASAGKLDAAVQAYIMGKPVVAILASGVNPTIFYKTLRQRSIPLRLPRVSCSGLPPERIAAAQAYIHGESALSIQARTGIRNQVLYADLARLGIKTRKAQKPVRPCRQCGKALKSNQKCFCSRQHERDWNWDQRLSPEARERNGDVRHCLHCDAPLERGQGRFCNDAHREAYAAAKWTKLKSAVGRRAGHLTVTEIANDLGTGPEKVRTALAEIAAEKEARHTEGRAA